MDSERRAIAIRGTHPVVTMPRERVHFLFGNGRFEYDCRSCRAHCCKGFGFTLHRGGELEGIIKYRPALAAFLETKRYGHNRAFRVNNAPPACFFLDSGDRCKIHEDKGYESKPETCRLFPFNVLRQCEDELLVTPHIGLCPLQVREDGAGSEQSRHEALYEEMSRAGLEGPIPRVYPATLNARRLIEVEEAVLVAADEHVNDGEYLAFAGKQLQLASEVQGLAERADWTAEAREFRAQLFGILGLREDSGRTLSRLDVAALVCVTPILRAEMLFPDRVPRLGMSLRRGARVLLGLNALASVARQAGMNEIRYQTATHLFREFRDLLYMLSLADAVVSVRDDALLPWPLSGPEPVNEKYEHSYLSVVRELIASSRRRHPKTLGDILRGHLDPSEVEHFAFLGLVARGLAGKIQPADAAVERGRWRGVAKAKIQRWMLRRLDEPTLAKLAQRQVRKPGAS